MMVQSNALMEQMRIENSVSHGPVRILPALIDINAFSCCKSAMEFRIAKIRQNHVILSVIVLNASALTITEKYQE